MRKMQWTGSAGKISLKILLGILLLFYLCNSFKRYTYFDLDGDLASIVLPSPSYSLVLKDPFGFHVLMHDSIYSATNRYFTHLFLSSYFKSVPLGLQHFFSPLDSVYISCAIAKIIVHAFLIYIIAVYITNKRKIWDKDVLLASAIIAPLFITYGYYHWMAIIDFSITYVFFYALSMCFMFLFFLPFLNAVLGRTTFNFGFLKIAWLVTLSIVISFSGTLNGPVAVLICSATLLIYFIKNFKRLPEDRFINRFIKSIRQIPSPLFYIFTFTICLGLYSFYIGLNNSENFSDVVPLSKRYLKLLNGFWVHYTYKIGPGLLLAAVIFNSILISKSTPTEEGSKIIGLLKWFAVLGSIYILLLPLGGYRFYRPDIIRHDTMLPVNITMILFYGYTTMYLLKNILSRKKLIFYSILICAISVTYINADGTFKIEKHNACEREAIEKIASSPDRVVLIETECNVFNWSKAKDPRESRYKAKLLLYWNVLTEQKLYYQK